MFLSYEVGQGVPGRPLSITPEDTSMTIRLALAMPVILALAVFLAPVWVPAFLWDSFTDGGAQ